MKISIKKKYIGITATLTSGILGFMFLRELWMKISQENIFVLIVPTVFLSSTFYAINHWLSLRFKEKLADEASRQVVTGDPQKTELVKNHLWNKSYEEAYTFNFLHKQIKFTSSWADQAEIEKNKTASHQEKNNRLRVDKFQEQLFRPENPIEVLGELIDPGNQPILYGWAKRNKPELERQLKSVADRWHEGSVRAAVLAMESDLAHG